MPSVEDIWRLALRFGNYDEMFSHRAYMIRWGSGPTTPWSHQRNLERVDREPPTLAFSLQTCA